MATKDEVKTLQTLLGVAADGILGPNTVKALQVKLGVEADGKLGPKTKAAAAAAGLDLRNFTWSSTPVGSTPAGKPQKSAKAGMHASLLAGKVPTVTDLHEAVAGMQPEARAVAADQLRAFAAKGGGTQEQLSALVQGLSQSIAPALANISDALATKVATTNATDESNRLTADAERWASTASTQAKILQAIQDLAVQVVAREKLAKRLYAAYGVRL